jgi:urea transport system ATP-binding protein
MHGTGSGPLAVVPVEPYDDLAAERADRYRVRSRGQVVMRGRSKAMAADGARARLAI